MTHKILVIGAGGQVGRALLELLGAAAVGVDQADIDLSRPEGIKDTIRGYEFSALINAAAYTQVDKAETEKELAFSINSQSPALLAEVCAERNVPFLHYSTDYVYAGSGSSARTENEPVGPLSVYGASKLAGDRAIAKSGAKYLIFRTSWVYDDSGKNFLNTMLRFGREREEMRVVDDQIGAPTYAADLAAATIAALDRAMGMSIFPNGVYHACNGGEASWFDFASEIFNAARAHGESLKLRALIPIPTSEYPTPAQRPHNSRLDCGKLRDVLGVEFSDWRDGLKRCMERVYEGKRRTA